MLDCKRLPGNLMIFVCLLIVLNEKHVVGDLRIVQRTVGSDGG